MNRPFSAIPGVTYPDETVTPAKVPAGKLPRPGRVRPVATHVVKIDGRNVSSLWLNRNGLCIRTIDGVRTVVPR